MPHLLELVYSVVATKNLEDSTTNFSFKFYIMLLFVHFHTETDF